MIEKVLKGNSRYWMWLAFLSALVAVGGICYIRQFNFGMGLTGMGRDVSWGLYISQFTFLVGVAAGGLMLVLPYYVHDFKAFGRITVLGEFLAIAALIICLMFILADIGQVTRGMNMVFHPTPNSMLFYDMIVLWGYLILNALCGWVILTNEKKGTHPPKWIYILVYISIPFAVSIHTVTAMLYCGLPGRHFWLSAITAPRFLASAFAAGPALIVFLCLVMKRVANFDAGEKALKKLTTIIMYSVLINGFFVGLEFFVGFYSNMPGHMETLQYLFFGIEHHGHVYNNLVPFMWAFVVFCIVGVAIFAYQKLNNQFDEKQVMVACALIFVGLWLDKGIGFVLGGMAVNPMNQIVEYIPTLNELGVAIGIWSFGALLVTLLYKVAIGALADMEK